MSQTALITLLEKFINDSASPDEVQQLRILLRQGEHHAYTKDWIEQFLANKQSDAYTDFDVQDMFREVIEKSNLLTASSTMEQESDINNASSFASYSPLAVSQPSHVHFLRMTWLRYAAVLLLIAGTSVFLYKIVEKPKQAVVQRSIKTSAGAGKAVLTLADGSTIILDDAAKGDLASQGGTKIIKLDGGALAYQAGVANGEALYNTISTPRGGQYQVVLPDGSQVWLNAASSVRFPVNAKEKDRQLTVNGEVYVEVKKDPERPFYVNAGNIQVEVLGTSFNINAYTEEDEVRTTLLEGAIKLREGRQGGVLLDPGQQGVLLSGKHGIDIRTADIEEVLAWKNGLFKFNNTNIDVVLRQIARWYDLDIVFERPHPADKFGGKISRKVSASKILEMIAASGVKLRQEGRKIIVL